RGLAQSIFQLGGNTGSAIGPLLVALIVVSYAQKSILIFVLFAGLAITVLSFVGSWYKHFLAWKASQVKNVQSTDLKQPRKVIIRSIVVLLLLIFSKFFYNASMSSYYTFYLIENFHISIQESQF